MPSHFTALDANELRESQLTYSADEFLRSLQLITEAYADRNELPNNSTKFLLARKGVFRFPLVNDKISDSIGVANQRVEMPPLLRVRPNQESYTLRVRTAR